MENQGKKSGKIPVKKIIKQGPVKPAEDGR